METHIAQLNPLAQDVQRLVAAHLRFTGAASPAEFAFALDHNALDDRQVTLFGLRRSGELLAIGALKHLDAGHAELKSMHTAERARGQGLGRQMLQHLLEAARAAGYRRVSLETGTTVEFSAARSLYARAGFVACAPFADYRASEWNTFMTLELGAAGAVDGLTPSPPTGAGAQPLRSADGAAR